MDTGYDIFFRDILGKKGNDFRFSKNRAGTADGSGMLRFEVPVPHFRHGDFQYLRHDVEETARTSGAFVVHGKLHDQALPIQFDGLDVLTADIEDGRRTGAFKEGPFGMARDFADFAFGAVDIETAIACGDDVRHVFNF